MKVKFNIRGSMWQDKYFVNLVAWYIEAGDAADDFEGMDGIPGFVTNGDRRIAGGGAGGMGASMNDLGGVWDEPAAMNPQPATPAPFSTGAIVLQAALDPISSRHKTFFISRYSTTSLSFTAGSASEPFAAAANCGL